jgi:hypothetical protein
VEGSAPSETDEEPTCIIGIRRAGNVGASVTPGVMPHRGKQKNEENLWIMVRTWTDRNPLRVSSLLKEGAVGVVGEKPPWKKTERRKDVTSRDLGKEGTATHH